MMVCLKTHFRYIPFVVALFLASHILFRDTIYTGLIKPIIDTQFLQTTVSASSQDRNQESGTSPQASHDNVDSHKSTVYGLLTSSPKIIQASMLQGSSVSEITEQCLQTHVKHGARWGYQTVVLRKDFMSAEGESQINARREEISASVWDKLLHVNLIIMQELNKPVEERAEWVMWLDADTLILNPSVPWSLFLPSSDHIPNPVINYVGTHEGNPTKGSMNAGVFIIRVEPWSVKLLNAASSYPDLLPNDPVGNNKEQEALRRTLLLPQFRSHALFQPKHWYNPIVTGWDGPWDRRPGDMMVHFAGRMDHDIKYAMMEKWLNMTEGPPEKERDVPLMNTRYKAEVAEYWSNVEEARSALREAEEFEHKAMKKEEKIDGESIKKLVDAEDTLRDIVYGYFYRPKDMKDWIKKLKVAESALR